MEIIEYIKQTITDFIVLYKIELLTFAGIIMVIYWIVTQQLKIDKVMTNE